ncbi:uncharacterized protein I303_106291 [Kwoniella dejecticola CBS 10117]|uniref:alpha-L-rhamnosidase n=1 Tax=Kwoniella dejecticola CBS 10117 TaxID=1296121 RepID=A0A1A6A1V1_9TREE|nr:alpha-L-rhamnosidase [Kwoniella dejecticola CBS 10117]OBR84024.1 alpha-L-rhamnosidase [Kwoniella dejecticola CBS 10117]
MSVQIEAVQAEHHESGFAIAHPSPRLSWRFISTEVKDWKQVSYEIGIRREGSDKGEDYKVDSDQSVLVPWPSQPLTSREIVHVKVRSNGSDGKSTDWKEITLEAALLDRAEWKANLISGPAQPKDNPKKPFRLRMTFNLDKTPQRGRLYATAHGLYEVEINGKKVGDQVLAPGWTSYKYHLNYQTYNVTEYLTKGQNTISAYISEGWFAGRLGRPGSRNVWGDRLAFLAQLEVDGSPEIVTDDTWECLEDGPIKNSEIYNGEIFDSTHSDENVKPTKVEVLPFPEAELISTDAPPVRKVKEVKPVKIITTPSGKTILDFGQNLVGWIRLEKDFEGKKGDELFIRTAEVLEHGELGTRPLRTAEPNDRILLGGKTKGWEPKFTFHGFRYAEINGVKPSLDDFTAIVIFSDMRRTGTFRSSHEMINRLHENVVWGMMSNFVSVPTDCPQRDERLGWTGDIQVFAPTANYLFDTSGFLGEWLKDVYAEQIFWKGVPPTVVPFVPPNKFNDPWPKPHAVWADVVAITPWDLYKSSGDQGLLENQWESMRLWLDKGLPRGENGLWDPMAPLYGDWLDPNAPPQYPAHGRTDTHLVGNAYLIYVTSLVAKIGRLLGKTAESEKYEKDAQRFKDLFQDEYLSKSGRIVADTQTAYALVLKFGLLKDDSQLKRAVKRLEWLTRWAYFKVSTGFAGTPILLPILAENGLQHIAYRMLQERDNPSWLYSVGMGATTIWERWDSALPDGTINPGQMTSFNHYALGAVAEFMHSNIGGLSPLEPGWKKALIKPLPGGTLTSASTSHSSPYGKFAVEWKIQGDKLLVDIEVPPNASAKVDLPGMKEEDEVGSGKKSYEVDWKGDERWPPKGIRGPQSIFMPDEFVP